MMETNNDAQNSRVKKLRGFLIKLAVSLILILVYIIFIQDISFGDIWRPIQHASLLWLAAALSLHGIGQLISAIRWKILIQAQGDRIPLLFLVQSYLVGMFFNLFLPGRIGGDVVRIWDSSRYSLSVSKSSAVVVVERLQGILVLFGFALAGSLLRLPFAGRYPVIWMALGLSLVGFLVFFLFLLPPAERLLHRLPEKGWGARVKTPVLAFRNTILHYRTQKPAFIRAMGMSLCLQLNVILYYFFITKALHLTLPIIDFFIFIPIVHFVTLIPITVNGLGLREMSFGEILKVYGLTAQAGISLGLVDFGFIIIVGLIGGLLFLLRK
ncbi:MAG: flippase-like domain-containing protein [Candidatus Aminicenantes bacterium]|nr:flippase-like domain-containing protein [Candidatus Aminicenantes bacterium]